MRHSRHNRNPCRVVDSIYVFYGPSLFPFSDAFPSLIHNMLGVPNFWQQTALINSPWTYNKSSTTARYKTTKNNLPVFTKKTAAKVISQEKRHTAYLWRRTDPSGAVRPSCASDLRLQPMNARLVSPADTRETLSANTHPNGADNLAKNLLISICLITCQP